jgi:hypothetical protein
MVPASTRGSVSACASSMLATKVHPPSAARLVHRRCAQDPVQKHGCGQCRCLLTDPSTNSGIGPCLLRRKHRSSTSQRTGSCSPACTRTIVELIQPAVPDGEFQQAGRLLSLVGAGGGRRPVSAVRRRRVGGTQPTILRLLLAPVRAVSQPCAGPTPREHRGIDHSAFGVTSTSPSARPAHRLRRNQHIAFSETSASGRCHSLSSGVNRSVSTAASRTTSSLQRIGSIRPVRHISVWSP